MSQPIVLNTPSYYLDFEDDKYIVTHLLIPEGYEAHLLQISEENNYAGHRFPGFRVARVSFVKEEQSPQ